MHIVDRYSVTNHAAAYAPITCSQIHRKRYDFGTFLDRTRTKYDLEVLGQYDLVLNMTQYDHVLLGTPDYNRVFQPVENEFLNILFRQISFDLQAESLLKVALH